MRLNQLFSIAFSIAFKNGANYLILREKKIFKKIMRLSKSHSIAFSIAFYGFSIPLAVFVYMAQNPFRIRLFLTFLTYISAE